MSVGLSLIRALSEDEADITFMSDYNLDDKYFVGDERSVLKFCNRHVSKYGKFPSFATLQTKFDDVEFPDETDEPLAYLVDQVKVRHVAKDTRSMVNEVFDLLREGKLQDSLDLISSFASDISTDESEKKIFLLSELADAVLKIHDDKQQQLVEDRVIPYGFPSLDNISGGAQPGETTAIVGQTGVGKALEDSTPVLTINGWKPISEVTTKDRVAGSDGKFYSVTGVYPQGERKLYRVSFSDGCYIDCDDSHLWTVNSSYRTSKGLSSVTMATTDIRCDPDMRGKYGRRKWAIPLINGFDGVSRTIDLPIDPYTLGVLLGDCSFRSGCPDITSDTDIILSMALPEDCELSEFKSFENGCSRFLVKCLGRGRKNNLKEHLKVMGLWGKKSVDKFIPECYLDGSFSDRLSILQGLLDTDGYICKSKTVQFNTSSERLAKDCAYIVRSLGGIARVTYKSISKYTYSGEVRCGLPSYRVSINLPRGLVPFRSTRRLKKWKEHTKYFPRRSISSIEPCGIGKATCISVDSPDNLFVAKDFIVTHNTHFACAVADSAFEEGNNVLICSMEMAALQIARIILARRAKVSETKIRRGELDTLLGRKRLVHEIEALDERDNWLKVIDGSFVLTVDHLEAVAKSLRPDLMIVDGAYLVKSRASAKDKWVGISDVHERIKVFTMALSMHTIGTYQLTDKMQTYGGRSIEHLAALVLHILYDEDANQDSSSGWQARQTRILNVIKGRFGEFGRIRTSFNMFNSSIREIEQLPWRQTQARNRRRNHD